MPETPINGISAITPGYREEINLDGAGPFDLTGSLVAGGVYTVDPQGNAVVVTISDPSAATDGRWFKFLMEDSVGGGTVTIITETSQPIGESTTQIISTNYRGFEIQDSTDHYTILQDSRATSAGVGLVLYGLDEASGVASYLASTSSQDDARYNATEQNLAPVAVAGAGVLLEEWVSPDGILDGVVPAGNWTGVARAYKSAGLADIEMYFELYHRTSVGVETLMGTSNTSITINGSTDAYVLTLFAVETTFDLTDRVVAKLYGNKVGTATTPSAIISVEGVTNPTRLSVAVPSTTLAHNVLQGLQGGTVAEYYHLTSAEYTGTGTNEFVRKTSPTLVTPNIGAATGTSLNVTGNIESTDGYVISSQPKGFLCRNFAGVAGNAFTVTPGDDVYIGSDDFDAIFFSDASGVWLNTDAAGNAKFTNNVEIDGALNHDGTTLGFYGATPVTQPTGDYTVLANLVSALASQGLILPT